MIYFLTFASSHFSEMNFLQLSLSRYMGQRDRIRDLKVHEHNQPHYFPHEQTLVQLQMVYLLTIPP